MNSWKQILIFFQKEKLRRNLSKLTGILRSDIVRRWKRQGGMADPPAISSS